MNSRPLANDRFSIIGVRNDELDLSLSSKQPMPPAPVGTAESMCEHGSYNSLLFPRDILFDELDQQVSPGVKELDKLRR